MDDWETERKKRYACPLCKNNDNLEMERKAVKDDDVGTYGTYYHDYIIYVCKECGNIYGVAI